MTTRKNFKKRVSTITAVLLAAAMLLGATYAWNDTRQHKTNPFVSANLGGGLESTEVRDVTLNNLFTPPTAWSWSADEDVETANNISVTNLATSSTHVFARITLKEYMDLRIGGANEYYLNDLGEQILVMTVPDNNYLNQYKGQYMTLKQAEERKLTSGKPLEIVTGYEPDGTPITLEYATTTLAEQRNGIFGKPMLKTTLGGIWGGVPKAPPVHGPQTPGKGECTYTPVIKGVKGAVGQDADGKLMETAIADHVRIGWNETEKVDGVDRPNIMSFTEWKAAGGGFVPAWIYDEVAADSTETGVENGWVYWGMPLAPGTHTSDLIKTIDTIKGEDPAGDATSSVVEYVLHSDMEAVSGFEWSEDGTRGGTEVDNIFTPKLPMGTTTDAAAVAARTEFFNLMNDHEYITLSSRNNSHFVKYNLGANVDATFNTRTIFDKNTAGTHFVPKFVNGATGTVAPKFAGKTFKGWASTSGATTADVVTYVATGNVWTVLTPEVLIAAGEDSTTLYAVWG